MRQLEHGGTSWFDPLDKFVFFGFLMLTGSSAKEKIKCPQLNLGWWREESWSLLEMQNSPQQGVSVSRCPEQHRVWSSEHHWDLRWSWRRRSPGVHSCVAFGTESCTPRRGCKNQARLQPGREIRIPGFVFFTVSFLFSLCLDITAGTSCWGSSGFWCTYIICNLCFIALALGTMLSFLINM